MKSRIEYFCTLGLAIGFGALMTQSLTSSDAVGYPGGAAISKGENPIYSTGGKVEFNVDSPTTASGIVTAPTDQELVITDVYFSMGSGHSYCAMRAEVDLLIDGEQVAAYAPISPMANLSYNVFLLSRDNQQTLASGIRIPAGSTLDFRLDDFDSFGSHCDGDYGQTLRYTLSGYYAQP